MSDLLDIPRPIKPVRVPPTSELRDWAQQRGLTSSTHGRLGTNIEMAYVRAHKPRRRRAR